MKVPFYLIITERGSTRTTKHKPSLYTNEIAIFINLDIPVGLFKKPSIVAEIKIPDEAVRNDAINADITDNIKEAIEKSTGLPITLKIEYPTEENNGKRD